ncbi:hypothetical protein [Amycolatopsis sp. WQ 127309]|uniref:hypothetical protein n=1 Tax=Amycolatopsis sp. WQ 127309 TaxID=2932773 RepID=UPI001FF1EB87|nr:hypothetical protein [Amycolatopsis sp. WQ 127309]UOZ06942.1 hypothetical protein MUY22_01205 [Amycolatopsis sp. WQ 127309]
MVFAKNGRRFGCAVLVAGGLAACGTTAAAPGGAEAGTPGPPASAAPAPSSATTTAPVAAASPGAAVVQWVTLILRGSYAEACLSGAPAVEDGVDPRSVCKGADEVGKRLRDAWAKPGVKLPPLGVVETDDITAPGDDVSVPDTAVRLDGRSLHELELVGATGDTSSFAISFATKKVDGKWYVGDLKLDA